jgi:site-specific DNA recombinase
MTDRPALAAIMDNIKKYNSGKSNVRIETFVVARIDRLGRTLLGTLQFIQDYIVSKKDSKGSTINNNRDDINFISVAENYCRIERNNPQGKFLLMLFASLAEFDRDQIVKKLKDGMISRVEAGKWPGGGNIPYGYKYNKVTGVLEVIPEQAEKIREIFRLYIEEKLSPQKIATRLGFKGEKVVMNILRRKSLTGCIEYNGKEYQGLHEAIIPLDLWEDAQDEIATRSVHRTDSAYLLSGLLQCGECGSRMRYQKWNKQGDCKIVCYSTQKSTHESKPYLVKDESCEQERFWACDVEEAVVETLFQMSYLASQQPSSSKPHFNPMEAIMRELKAEKMKLGRLYDFDDEDEDDVLKDKILVTKARIKELERQLHDEQQKATITKKVEKAKNIIRNLKAQWPNMTAQERQNVCQELIEKIVIYKDCTIDVRLKLRSYLVQRS